jgi:hypothetical protein
MKTCIKEFEVREGTIANSWYSISVLFRGEVVAHFTFRTMKEAQEAFRRAGYIYR